MVTSCPLINDANECGANNQEVIGTVQVHVPSLCNSCFWREERSVAKAFDVKIHEAEWKIADLRWTKRAEMDGRIRRQMTEEMSRLALILDDLRDEKSEAVGAWNSLYAWADGRKVVRDKY